MATNVRASTANGTHTGEAPKSYFEQQRELLMTEIAQSLEHVLQNVNRLNRSLEEVIQVGNEFAPVESLWSHFEAVMGQREDGDGEDEQQRERERGQEGKKEGGHEDDEGDEEEEGDAEVEGK